MEHTKDKIREFLNKGYGIKRIAKLLIKNPSTIRQHVKELNAQGVKTESRYKKAVPQETEGVGMRSRSMREPKLPMELSTTDQNQPMTIFIDRCHDISIKYPLVNKGQFKIATSILDFPKEIKEGWVSASCGTWQEVKLNNNSYWQRKIKGYYLKYTKKNLIIHVPEVWAKTSKEAIEKAKELSKNFLVNHKGLFTGLLIGGLDYEGKIISQHHAIVKHPVAKMFKDAKESYRDDRLMIDASNNVPELEFIHSKEAEADHKKYTDFANDVIRNNPPNLSQLTAHLIEIDKRLELIAQAQLNTSKTLDIVLKLNTPRMVEETDNIKRPYYMG